MPLAEEIAQECTLCARGVMSPFSAACPAEWDFPTALACACILPIPVVRRDSSERCANGSSLSPVL